MAVAAVTLNRAVPGPADDPPDATEANAAEDAADHAHPAAVVTVSSNPPAIAERGTEVGETEYEHGCGGVGEVGPGGGVPGTGGGGVGGGDVGGGGPCGNGMPIATMNSFEAAPIPQPLLPRMRA